MCREVVVLWVWIYDDEVIGIERGKGQGNGGYESYRRTLVVLALSSGIIILGLSCPESLFGREGSVLVRKR